ncbi:pilus assembly protein PilP [sulfur-oxidizing endosymbiont of Gigantopelta aegis]|uniref:pilus assembly protein PilP n=1 Tax=sulfur-oxidizing endosymbiont of Gigantopelta aegis TaxID=2794934 RepID=UPI001FE90EFF|nr:pilus assembly protein PilP [sulfur-oxidizing endosymbiont of Gigantopelta aegis]
MLIISSLMILSGCVNNDMSDLQGYVQKTKATYKGKVKHLPEFITHPPYAYNARDIRDPFKPVVDIEVFSGPYRGPRPDEARPREPLEDFSLDSLRMVGTLAQKESEWILIKDPDGLLHRVSIGHYMGKNYGRVTAINEEYVLLLELVSDGKGGWEERKASIALKE